MAASRLDSPRTVHVLLVEDNPGDARLVEEGFESGTLDVALHVVDDGVKALDFLRRSGAYAEARRPDMVLLDLDLPGRHGRDVLAAIKSDPDLRSIPVCVLTSSSSEADVLDAYDRYANSYVTKPMELDLFMDAVRRIEQFWLSLAVLPRAAEGTA